MDKSQIEAFLSRIDVWLLIFGVIVVVGVADESFFGVRHWWNSRRLQTIQRTEDQQREQQIARLNKEAGEARKTAGEAHERAAQAEAHLGEANERSALVEQHAAEADVKAESFRLDIAKANESAAQAQAQVASATAEAAKANLLLKKLRTPRSLSEEQRKRIASKLKSFPPMEFDVALMDLSDPQDLLPQLENALEMAGWTEIDWKGSAIVFERAPRPTAGLVTLTGVVIQMHKEQVGKFGAAAVALAQALNAEGIDAKAEPGVGPKNDNANAIHILIGEKPK